MAASKAHKPNKKNKANKKKPGPGAAKKSRSRERRPAQRRSLSAYQGRRDFARTPEPSGGARTRPAAAAPAPSASSVSSAPAGALFFCVQKHLASRLHYDFRLEHRGVLLSWAVPKGPSLNPKDKRLALQVEDHPLDYGGFEGVIPEGYGAGIVMLWDRGTWTPQSAVEAGLRRGELKFSLDGAKLKGSWVLVRTTPRGRSGATKGPAHGWLLIKHRDEWAGALDITRFAPLSIKSGGDFEDILARENPDVWQPRFLKNGGPKKGGAAGRLLREIAAKAARRK